MDIRNYFSAVGSKSKKPDSGSKPDRSSGSSSKPSKKSKRILDSDDEDPLPPKKKPTIIALSDSDEDIFSSKKKTPAKEVKVKPVIKPKKDPSPTKTLKPASVLSFFGTAPISQSSVKDKIKSKSDTKSIKENSQSSVKSCDGKDHISPTKADPSEAELPLNDEAKPNKSNCESSTPSKRVASEKPKSIKKEKESCHAQPEKVTSSSTIPKSNKAKPKEESAVKGSKLKLTMEVVKNEKKEEARTQSPDMVDDSVASALDTSLLEEKKKQQVMAYRKYMQRAGPRNPGSKIVPEGAPGCLSGLVFVLSGVLDSLDRTEVTEIVQRYGGRIVTSVSGKMTHLLVGEDAGASKTAKAEQMGRPIITEDDFLEMLRNRPGTKAAASESAKAPSKAANKPSPKVAEKKAAVAPFLPSSPAVTPPSSAHPSPSSSRPSPSTQQSSPGSSQKTAPLSSQELQNRSDGAQLMWVDKYKPATIKNIVGQQGDKSNAKKLVNWLKNWTSNHNGVKKHVKPSPWAKNHDGAFFKAALLSGPPGVGKTTTAQLVCQELGFDVVELNASDTRSKRSLSEEVAQQLKNTSLGAYTSGGGITRRRALLMDEVDGMAGNEDRGGVPELILLIKTTRVPIICMCNDRNHSKIRSLANHCFDLRFQKPRIEQIRGAMMSVCFREGIKLKPEALDQIIIGSNQDVRQVLHHLSMFSAKEKNLDSEGVKRDANRSKKDMKIGPWDVCRQVFSDSDRRDMSIHDKCNLFFHDYSLGPLFVQENYWKAKPKVVKNNNRVALLKQLATAAEHIASGDLVERTLRTNNNWSLLPTQAAFSCLLPGEAMSGHMGGEIEFPSWLGNNSKKNKMDRLSQELHMHMRLKISGTKTDVALEYGRAVRRGIVRPLLRDAVDGVPEAVDAITQYDLLREDLDSLGEMSTWSGGVDEFSRVESKVKAAFTRALNKSSALTPYSTVVAPKKKRGTASQGEPDEFGDIEEIVSEDEDNDVSADAMIKVKKQTKKAPSSTATDSKKAKK